MARFASVLAGGTLGLLALSTAALPTAALAQQPGYTLPQANLRAGPGRDYPFISAIPPGRPVSIQGCVGGYGWCDVEVDGLRGWINGRKLQVIYGDRRVGLEYYAPRLALPVITFSLGEYWGRFYQARPFYADRGRWDHGRPPVHPVPQPRPEPRPAPRPTPIPFPPPSHRPDDHGPGDHRPGDHGPGDHGSGDHTQGDRGPGSTDHAGNPGHGQDRNGDHGQPAPAHRDHGHDDQRDHPQRDRHQGGEGPPDGQPPGQ